MVGAPMIPNKPAKADIHNVAHRLELALAKVVNDTRQPNRDYILQFKDVLASESISTIRIAKYVQTLKKFDSWLGRDFKTMTKADVQALVGKIETSNYEAWTKHDNKVVIKRFWRWLSGVEDGYPPEVRWIRTTLKNCQKKLPEEILTQVEVRRLIDAAKHPQTKALISLFYESGCRPCEGLVLKPKHFEFDRYGAQVMFPAGKTGMRRVRLIHSIPHISLWLDQHPTGDRDDPLWMSRTTMDRPDYDTINYTLKEVVRRASLPKSVYLTLFRHTRATHLAPYLTEAQMCDYFGWVYGSRMPAFYIHMAGKATDDRILEIHGLKKVEFAEEKSPLQPIKCPRCLNMNPPEFKFCGRCSMVLDVQEAMKLQSLDETVAKVLGRMLEKGKNKADGKSTSIGSA